MKQSFLILVSMVGVSALGCSGCQSRSPETRNSATTVSQPATAAPDKPVCSLTLTSAPEIKGLKLGQTPAQVMALFPGSERDAKVRSSLAGRVSEFGVSSFAIRPDQYQSKEAFAGVSQITFTLLDGRVSAFSVGYNGPEYSTVDKFVANFVEGKNLPATDAWDAYLGMDNQLKILKCTDFEIRVFVGGAGGNQNYVLMSDLAALMKLKNRRDIAKANATPEREREDK